MPGQHFFYNVSVLLATIGVTIPRFLNGSVSRLRQKVDIDTNIYNIIQRGTLLFLFLRALKDYKSLERHSEISNCFVNVLFYCKGCGSGFSKQVVS
jgi:hypothetical protein